MKLESFSKPVEFNELLKLYVLVIFCSAFFSYTILNPANGLMFFLLVSFVFTISIIFFKNSLRLFYIGWINVGIILGTLVSPILLSVIFYLLFTPIAIVGRLLGRDELKIRHAQKETYWIDKEGKKITSESFHDQF